MENENRIGKEIVDVAVKIHQKIGPGLLEHAYEMVMVHQLRKRGLEVRSQVAIPLKFEDLYIETAFRADLIVENMVLIELKSVERDNPAHKKQVLTYMSLADLQLGFLLNFSKETMREGITRLIKSR